MLPTPALTATPAPTTPVCVVAVVVTHRPDLELLRRQTLALRAQVAHIIWVDNGSGPELLHEAAQWGVSCMALAHNHGVGFAQNRGIERALAMGATHILLLDHDSIPAPDMVAHLLAALQQHPRAAAAGPCYADPRGQRKPPFVQIRGGRTRRLTRPAGALPLGACVEVDHLIASGCLIRQAAWRDVGPMDEDLFIDFVDVLWCLRARARDWTVVGVWDAHMSHQLGQHVRQWLGRPFQIHSPQRHYYHVRNAVYLLAQPWIGLSRRWATAYRLLLKIGFYALVMDNRHSYLVSTWRGVRHGVGLARRLQ